MDIYRCQKGFTLTELLVSVALLGILAVSALSLLSSGVFVWKLGDRKIELLESIRIGQDRLTRELRYAKTVLPQSNNTNLHIRNAEGKTVRYYSAAAALYRQEQGAVPQPIASDIQSLKIVYFCTDGLEILDVSKQSTEVNKVIVTLAAENRYGMAPLVVSSTVTLRSRR